MALLCASFTVKYLTLLTEHETLNQRVPGSSPGAPTKLFRDLAVWTSGETDTVSITVYSFVLASSFRDRCLGELNVAAESQSRQRSVARSRRRSPTEPRLCRADRETL